jgi:hypothetical protein
MSTSTVTVQGFTINAPAPPTVDANGNAVFTTSPTTLQIVATSEILPQQTVVVAQFQWVSVYQGQAEENPLSQTVTNTTGVTTSDSETSEFAVSLGLEESAEPDGIGVKLNETFTATYSSTTSISLDTESSVANTFTVNANTTGQVWQLWQVFLSLPVLPQTPQTLSQQLNYFLSLSYPA